MNWLQKGLDVMEICFLNTGLNVKFFKAIIIIRRMETEWNKLANLKFIWRNKRRLFENIANSPPPPTLQPESNSLCMNMQSLSEYASLYLACDERSLKEFWHATYVCGLVNIYIYRLLTTRTNISATQGWDECRVLCSQDTYLYWSKV